MQINSQVSLKQFTLNISNTSKAGLKFNQGEILKGQVQEIKGNGLVSINLKGKLIDALTTVEVKTGQELFLMVDGMKDGKANLKVLTPEMVNKMGTSNLSNALKEMNLPSNDKNIQIAKKLIQHNLPVTAENIKTMSKGVHLLNGVSPKNLELVGMAMAKDAPINSQTLESLAQFVEAQSDLASLTKETLDFLNKMEIARPALTESQAAVTTNTQRTSSNDAFKLLKQLVETITLPVDQSSETDLANEITQAIKSNLTNEDDLVRGLGLVKDILGQKEMPEVSKNLKNLLIDKLDQMEKELAGQKISNVMSRFSSDSDSNFYYLSFPVKFEDQYRLSQLKISKNAGKQSLADADNIKFVASLDTSKLGLVLFHVEWHKSSSLKIQGIVENQTALKHIETNVNKLIKNLESQNYVVEYNGIQVSTNANEDMRLKLEEKTQVLEAFEIDFWV